MTEELTRYTTLPSGALAAVTIGGTETRAGDYGVVRIASSAGDRIGVAHPTWMSLECARAVAAALFELASEDQP